MAPRSSNLKVFRKQICCWRKKHLRHCWDFSAPPAVIRCLRSDSSTGELRPPLATLVTPLAVDQDPSGAAVRQINPTGVYECLGVFFVKFTVTWFRCSGVRWQCRPFSGDYSRRQLTSFRGQMWVSPSPSLLSRIHSWHITIFRLLRMTPILIFSHFYASSIA